MSDMTELTGARERWTHTVHVGHLVMGLAFAGLVGIWAAIEYGAVPTDDLRWLLPLPWVLGGLAGLLAVLFSGQRRRATAYAPAQVAPAAPAEEAGARSAGDTPSDTRSDTRSDTASDTASDTGSDTASDTAIDTAIDTEIRPDTQEQ